MKCFFYESEARGVCRFCGRGVCKDHADKRMPYIATVYVGAPTRRKRSCSQIARGVCKPEAELRSMPEIY